MSKGTLGSFNGTTTANVNMLDIFKQNEMAAHENSLIVCVVLYNIKSVRGYLLGQDIFPQVTRPVKAGREDPRET